MTRATSLVLLLGASVALVFGAAPAQKCPTSESSMHAGCQVTISFKESCDAVRAEIGKRAGGQFDTWHDPHNNGSYAFIGKSNDLFQLSRLTGDGKYTDKINFVFAEEESNTCEVAACSESQSFSIGDYGTNFCNIHDLYCSDEGCHPFARLTYTETVGKCTESSPSKCLTV